MRVQRRRLKAEEVAKEKAEAQESARMKTPLHPRPAWAEKLDNTTGQAIRVDISTNQLKSSSNVEDLSMYRLSLEIDSPTSVNVRYFYPPGNAAIRNAWIGLFHFQSLDWKEEYGHVESGSSKLAWKMITSNNRAGVLRFGKLPSSIADGDYVFTLQVDYGVECRAASEIITVRARS